MTARDDFQLLFSAPTRRRFGWATAGTAATALADAAGMSLIVPLMQLLSGSPQHQGVLGWISGLFGDPSRATLAIYLAVFTFGAFFVKGVAVIAFRWWLLGFVSLEAAGTSARLLRYYLRAPYGLHLKRNSAEFVHVMNDSVRVLYKQVVIGVINIISEFITIIAISLTLVVLVPVPALLMLLYFMLAVGVFYWVVRPMARRAGIRLVSSGMSTYQSSMQALGGIKEIRIRHKAPFFLRRYLDARQDFAEAEHAESFIGEFPKYTFEVVFVLGIGGLSLLIFATSSPSESVTALAALTAAGFRLMPSAARLVNAMGVLRLGRPAYEVVMADLRVESADEQADAVSAEFARREPVPDEPVGEPFRLRREVALEDVTFFHDGREKPAVDGVTIRIPVGGAVALVGPSGAGKSTIVDLLLGLYTPAHGQVAADGRSIQDFLPSWQRSVGLVPQEVYLLDASLRANIAFGEEEGDIDPDRMAEAIAGAQLSELVAQLPEGLESYVGERGIRLSGGQRQRIGIARALYTRPELLILDEATSALDNETERRISDTISQLHGTVTIVIIAHRLSTVRDTDTVIFLQDGRVAASGGFDELQVLNDDFARLVELGSLT